MWRFAQVTDPHLASQRDGEWNNRFLCTMMPGVMRQLGEDLRGLAPDFLLVTGDICSHQSREAMLEARDMMESIGLPYYPMGGNHDFVTEGSRQWFLEAFEHRLPVRETFYSFDHKGLHFCVLDPFWVWSDGTLSEYSEAEVAAELDLTLDSARWAVPPGQFAWLEEDLIAHPGRPTVIASHYPLVDIPERLRNTDTKSSGALENGRLLLEHLAAFPQVKAVFSGHMHMNYVVDLGNIKQVVTAALPEYPTEYREVRVYDDRLEIATHGLSDPAYAARSLIPGREYTAGQPKDRETIIPLA